MRDWMITALAVAMTLAGCGHRAGRAVYSPGPSAVVGGGTIDSRVRVQALAAAPQAEEVGAVYKAFARRKGEGGEWSLRLDEGKCYWFSAAADATVRQLELTLRDSRDNRLAGRKVKGSDLVVDHCPEATGMYRVSARVKKGGGQIGLGVFAQAAPPKPEPELGAVVDGEAAAVAPGAERVGAYYEGSARRTSYHVSLTKGSCYFWVGAGRKAIESMELTVLGPGGRRLAHNRSTTKVSVGHCPTRSGMYRFQVAVGPTAAEHKIGLYSKPKEVATSAPPAPTVTAPPPAPQEESPRTLEDEF